MVSVALLHIPHPRLLSSCAIVHITVISRASILETKDSQYVLETISYSATHRFHQLIYIVYSMILKIVLSDKLRISMLIIVDFSHTFISQLNGLCFLIKM